MLNFEKTFKWLLNRLKELKETISKELKRRMRIISHQREEISNDMEIINIHMCVCVYIYIYIKSNRNSVVKNWS
jgi:hypothetical protein